MRELKCRAWDVDDKQFVYAHIGQDDIWLDDGIGTIEMPLHHSDFEQYTGLKDKNGKEIYEGDIVKMPDWQIKPKFEVVRYTKAGFNPFQEGCPECWSADGEEVEVIGNIHENKELLKGEE